MIQILDHIVVALIIATVPAANTFWLVYIFTTRWTRTLPSRALMVKSASTMLLIDLALLVRVFDVTESILAVFRLIVMTLICLGVNLMTLALLREKWPLMRGWRSNYTRGTSNDEAARNA